MSANSGKSRGWAAAFFTETALEVIAVKPSGSDVSVEFETSEPLAEAMAGQGAANQFQTTAQTLRQRVNLEEHRIVTAVACEDVLCQTLRLPTTQTAELKQMLDLQIDNLTPYPVEEIVYSFEALETTETDTLVLVAVARKAAVNERVAALEAVGWRAETVVIDGLAVLREALRKGTLPGDGRLNSLVLLSPAAANIFAFSSGRIVTVRSVMLGASANGPETDRIVTEELTRTLMAAEVDQPGLAPGRVSFATWTEALQAPVAQLASQWDSSAVVLHNGSSPNPVRSVCFESTHETAAALNLLPEEWRERRHQAQVRRTLIRGGIALAAVYALALAGFLAMMFVKGAQQHRMEAELRRIQPQFQETKELNKTLLAMRRQLDTEYSGIELLREVSVLLPDNVKLSGFTYKKDDSVKLRVQAQSTVAANDLISRLEQSKMFLKVAPEAMRSEPVTGLTKFDVLCSLKTSGYGNK